MAVSSVMDAVGEVGAMSDFAWETFQSKKFHIFFSFMLIQMTKGSTENLYTQNKPLLENCSFCRKGTHCQPASPTLYFVPLINVKLSSWKVTHIFQLL